MFPAGAGAGDSQGFADGITPWIPQRAHRMHCPIKDKSRIHFRTGQDPQLSAPTSVGIVFCGAEGFTQPTIQGNLGNDTGISGPILKPRLSGHCCDCRASWNSFNQKDNIDWNHNFWESELLGIITPGRVPGKPDEELAFNLGWINTKCLESLPVPSWFMAPVHGLKHRDVSTHTSYRKKTPENLLFILFKVQIQALVTSQGDWRAQSQSNRVHQVFKAKVQKFLQRFCFSCLKHKMPMLHLERAWLTMTATLGMN